MTKAFNGNYITEYRAKNKLTQMKFAAKFNAYLKECGIESTYKDKAISMWENGNREPQNIDIVKALADFIGVSVENLCGGDCGCETSLKFGRKKHDDIDSSSEIESILFGDNTENDDGTITSRFWEFIPIEYCYEKSNDLACFEPWSRRAIDIIGYTCETKELDTYSFRSCVCDYVYENMDGIKSSEDLMRYLFDRFDDEHICEMYSCFLDTDISAYESDARLPHSFTIKDCVAIDKHYTTKGLLVRIETTFSMNQNAYNQMYRDYCELAGHERVKDLVSKNKATLKVFIN